MDNDRHPSVLLSWASERHRDLKEGMDCGSYHFRCLFSAIRFLPCPRRPYWRHPSRTRPLFRHIRYMMITTVPSLIITLIIFTVAGLSHDASNTQHIAEVAAALNAKVPYHPVAADYTDSNRHIDCTESAFHHYSVSVHSIGGHFRSDLPTGFVAGNFGGCCFQLRLPV